MFPFGIPVDIFLYFQGLQQNTSETFCRKEEQITNIIYDLLCARSLIHN